MLAAASVGYAAQADAADFWPDDEPAFYWARPHMPHRARKAHRLAAKREAPARQAVKPQAPLIIAISINDQTMKLYDANGLFAETPISTGMRGHTTPMGAFSVIQKQKLHHSNIYSGAPMPYMQRITWSGIAIHAGVLPGYPASHGCVRMPLAFAIKMYGWTRMGARVVVTPGEITPASISHPLLAMSSAPQPRAAEPAMPADQPTDAAETAKPAILQARLELRATVGHPAIFRRMTVYTPPPAPPVEPGSPQPADPALTTGIAPARSVDPALQTVAVNMAENRSAGLTSGASLGATEPAKDPGHVAGPGSATAVAPEPNLLPAPNRATPISVFVSRKDAKLYVRQNFAPLFEVPIEIAASDRPLGTHVFTVEPDKDDPARPSWSVMTLPAAAPNPALPGQGERKSRRSKTMAAAGLPAVLPDSPTEALDRIDIPSDARARIAAGLSVGSSIIVSDQGISAGETGEGTDFIVSLR